ncbi:TlpA family protein disulfide reductase [Lewinella sp. IMCC34191]|uniref:TlpA family protein disulfide reductase n=1 Tax=Lewinella sp. IMCC34191 TaxID=2259172 RepID=UPI000E21EA13|nr:TlpA disulfide reductase family protein [Lewinella sp. IMCC34191]
MHPQIKRFLNSWLFPILLFGGLYMTGLHTPVLAFFQRGILATGLLQPEMELAAVDRTDEQLLVDLADLRVANRDGRLVDPSRLAGKVIFLNLWASWCPPCLAEMPNIDALYGDYADDDRVAFVMLNVEQDFGQGKDLIQNRGYAFPVYHLRGRLPAGLESGTLPTTYLIDSSGRVVVRHRGMAQYDTEAYREMIDRLSVDAR